MNGNVPSGVSPRKWARLASFLGELPPASAAKLFAALERRREDEGLPAAPILNILRRRLISEGAALPPRKRTAKRLFFAPFEDFIVAARRGRKRRARLDRASLSAVWSLLLEDSSLAAAARAAADLDAALGRGDADIRAYEEALFAAAAEGFEKIIAHAEEDAAYRADLEGRLGGRLEGRSDGAAALLDLAELSLLLPAAAHLKAAQAAFPRPLSALTEEDLYAARRIYARAAADIQGAAGYLLLAIAARMDRPALAAPLYYHLSRAEDGGLPHAREDAAAILESLFDDLESMARGLERDADHDPDTEEAPARLVHFADFAAGLIEAAARENDAVTINRAEACRDIAAAALSRYAETALGAVRRNHPVRHAGGSSRLKALRPDILRPVDRAAERDARDGARFLAAAPAIAERLDRSDAALKIAADAAAEMRRYAADLVLEIRAAEGEERAAARRRMEATLRAASFLLAADEVALLRERAAAAAVTA